MGKAEDFFKKVANAPKTNGGGVYIVHGNYELDVKRVEMKVSQNPETKDKMMWIVEFEVLSFTGGKYTDKNGQAKDTTGTFSRGSIVSDVINLEDPYGNGLPNAKKLAACILASKHGASFDEVFDKIDEDDMKSLCGPEQPGVGARLKLSAANIVTKKTRNDFTTKVYEPVHVASKAA